MAKDDILVINAANMTTRTRATKSGRAGSSSTVITMTVTSEPITYNVSPAAVLREASIVMARRIREQTEAISEPVKPSTARARAVQERAFAKGKPWALKRFSGGKMGVIPPRGGEQRMMNHSGRLAESIVARFVEKTGEFYINYAANRWNPASFTPAQLEVAFRKWVKRCPALEHPGEDIEVQRAFQLSHSQMVEKHKVGTTHKQATSKMQLAVKILQAGEQAVG
jgi:hypothetical protein